ncbi:MAG: hypothetical protein Q9200_001260 [Gallowayella weberi]
MDQTKPIPTSSLAKHSLVAKDGYIVGTSVLAKSARRKRPALGASKNTGPAAPSTLGKRKVDDVDCQIVGFSTRASSEKDGLERPAVKRVRSKHPLTDPNLRNKCLDQNAAKVLTAAVDHSPIPRPIAHGAHSGQGPGTPDYPSKPMQMASDYRPNPLPVPRSYSPYAPPFDWFTHSGNRPLDANQDITWILENGYYRAYRLSTKQQDPYAVPHLMTVQYGLRDIKLAKWHLAYLKHQITGNANTKWDDRVLIAPLPKSSSMLPPTVMAPPPKPVVQSVPQSTARQLNPLTKPSPGMAKLSNSQGSGSALTPTVKIGNHSGGVHPSGGQAPLSTAWKQSYQAPSSVSLPGSSRAIEKTRHTEAVLSEPKKDMLNPIPQGPRVLIAPHQQAYLFHPEEVTYGKEWQKHKSESNNMNRPLTTKLHTNSSVPISLPKCPILPSKAPEVKLSVSPTTKHPEAKPASSTVYASPKDPHHQVNPEKYGKAKVNPKPRPRLTEVSNTVCELPDTDIGSSIHDPISCTKDRNLRRSTPPKEDLAAFMSMVTTSSKPQDKASSMPVPEASIQQMRQIQQNGSPVFTAQHRPMDMQTLNSNVGNKPCQQLHRQFPGGKAANARIPPDSISPTRRVVPQKLDVSST